MCTNIQSSILPHSLAHPHANKYTHIFIENLCKTWMCIRKTLNIMWCSKIGWRLALTAQYGVYTGGTRKCKKMFFVSHKQVIVKYRQLTAHSMNILNCKPTANIHSYPAKWLVTFSMLNYFLDVCSKNKNNAVGSLKVAKIGSQLKSYKKNVLCSTVRSITPITFLFPIFE